jgi:hypothetical protein
MFISDDQVLKYISQLKGHDILEICEFKTGVKKIYAKLDNQLGIFFIKDEGLITKDEDVHK